MLGASGLLSVPGEVAKEMFLQSVAEYVERVTGFRVPLMETIISDVWRAMPFLAVVAIAYLYHLIYSQMNPRGSTAPVWESVAPQRMSIKEWVAASFSVACLIVFVATVGVAEWRYLPSTAESLKYADLAHLSNSDLRGRAFAVGSRLLVLNEAYQAKQKEINERFEDASAESKKSYDQFTKDMEEYKKKVDEYNAALPAPSPFQSTLTGQNLFGLQGNGTSQFTGLGIPNYQTRNATLPGFPSPPSPPAAGPTRPTVKVDEVWARQLSDTQEEYAAIWEEIFHRLGTYAPQFSAPDTYNYYRTRDVDLSQQAAKLETLANSLH